MKDFKQVLSAYLLIHKDSLLNADQLIRDLTPLVPQEDTQNFMLFQSVLRKVNIGSILKAADDGSPVIKEAAKEKAMAAMREAGVGATGAEYTLRMLTEAMGWEAEAAPTAAPASATSPAPQADVTHTTESSTATSPAPKSSNQKQTMLIGIGVVLIVLLGALVYKQFSTPEVPAAPAASSTQQTVQETPQTSAKEAPKKEEKADANVAKKSAEKNDEKATEAPSSKPLSKTLYVVNCRESITLRTAPYAEADEITQVPLGQVVGYLSNAGNGFYKVNYDGQIGYALSAYLSDRR